MRPLASTDCLERSITESNVVVLDATKFTPGSGRDAYDEYIDAHIPTAVFLNLASLTDRASGLVNMAPSPRDFAVHLQALGVSHTDRLVVYDNSPLRSAARSWWLLRLFGVRQVAVLDGGFPKWKSEGRAIQRGPVTRENVPFEPNYVPALLRTKAQMLANMTSKTETVVDARPHDRFVGDAPDPRPGVAAGHIPNSYNLPFGNMFEADGTYKSPAELRRAFHAARVELSEPLITTCGSGMTASVLAFAAHLLGKTDVALYDGSWSEWGADPTTPKSLRPQQE